MTQDPGAIVAPTIPGPVPATRKPRVRLPAGSCDCHAHVFGPRTRYRYDPKRRYTPPDALVPDYLKMLRTLGVERGVLVQPSVYLSDNTALLDALKETDFPLRGVAVVDGSVTAGIAQSVILGAIRLRPRFPQAVLCPRMSTARAGISTTLSFVCGASAASTAARIAATASGVC